MGGVPLGRGHPIDGRRDPPLLRGRRLMVSPSRAQPEVWLVKILWVLGHRIDDSMKVAEGDDMAYLAVINPKL